MTSRREAPGEEGASSRPPSESERAVGGRLAGIFPAGLRGPGGGGREERGSSPSSPR